MAGNKLTLLLIIIIGACVGWFTGQFAGQQNRQVSTEAGQADTQTDQLIKRIAIESEVEKNKPSAEFVGETSPVNPNTGEAELLALIFQDTEDYQLTASRIFDYLDAITQDHSRSVLAEKTLRQLIRNIPEINYALLDQLMDIESDQVRSKLETVFMINNSVHRPFLEPKVMDKIKLNENRSQWLRVVGDWGLQAKSNIDYLIEEMPYFENPVDVGSSIRAISNSSWAMSSALSPDEQRAISETVKNYYDSEHAEVRAASIAALRSFPGSDFEERLIIALQDPSEIVRNEASMIYRNNPFPSTEIQQLISVEKETQQ